MTVVLLSAGEATRMKELAPGGCKALAAPGGRTMIDWTRQATGEIPLVVCRSSHAELLGTDASAVVCDQLGGPVKALEAALQVVHHSPVTVLYSDTWIAELPEGEFCGIAAVCGQQRFWDVVEDGLCAYRHVASEEPALVCVGAYRFHDWARLRASVSHALSFNPVDCSMSEVVNRYGLRFRPVPSWQDIGDQDAFGRFRC